MVVLTLFYLQITQVPMENQLEESSSEKRKHSTEQISSVQQEPKMGKRTANGEFILGQSERQSAAKTDEREKPRSPSRGAAGYRTGKPDSHNDGATGEFILGQSERHPAAKTSEKEKPKSSSRGPAGYRTGKPDSLNDGATEDGSTLEKSQPYKSKFKIEPTSEGDKNISGRRRTGDAKLRGKSLPDKDTEKTDQFFSPDQKSLGLDHGKYKKVEPASSQTLTVKKKQLTDGNTNKLVTAMSPDQKALSSDKGKQKHVEPDSSQISKQMMHGEKRSRRPSQTKKAIRSTRLKYPEQKSVQEPKRELKTTDEESQEKLTVSKPVPDKKKRKSLPQGPKQASEQLFKKRKMNLEDLNQENQPLDDISTVSTFYQYRNFI